MLKQRNNKMTGDHKLDGKIFLPWQKCEVREMLANLLIPKINYLFGIFYENLEHLLELTIQNGAPGWSWQTG